MEIFETEISGWGRFPKSRVHLARPSKLSSLHALISAQTSKPRLARGFGRSYGDASQLKGSLVVDLTELNHFLAFDSRTGRLRCEAGVSLADLLEVFVPKGWFPKVLPGTKQISVGGAFAADIHGKNHHQIGSFCNHVSEIELLSADAKRIRCSPWQNADLFWATAGGMGLTGMVLECEMSLQPIESAWMRVDYDRSPDLAEVLRRLKEEDDRYPYSVAWVDCHAKGHSLGRSILMRAVHAQREELSGSQSLDPLRTPSPKHFSIPLHLPNVLGHRVLVQAFNALYYRMAMDNHRSTLVPYESYFFPLDSVDHWNRLYGSNGFLQYQFVIPEQAALEGLIRVLEQIHRFRVPCPLAVLKRFGPGHSGLSFPREGLTLALDFPVSVPGIWALLDQLDQIILEHGGRVYLAKDSRLSPETFRQMYPEFREWFDVKKKYDPDFHFRSDLSDRLRLDEGP